MLLLQAVWLFFCPGLFAYPIKFTDSGGNNISLEKKPLRVVSLVPGITEIIMGLGACDSLYGITYHSADLPGAEYKTVVGGFNPQVKYGCGGSTGAWTGFLNRPGWREVDAVRNNRIEESWTRENLINDFKNKSLVIDFKRPLSIDPTLEGYRQGIETVMNHYSSPAGWAVNHNLDTTALKLLVYPVIGQTQYRTASLFTGADMDNLSIKKAQYREMEVYALVTAGVTSNALRMAKDSGPYYRDHTEIQ